MFRRGEQHRTLVRISLWNYSETQMSWWFHQSLIRAYISIMNTCEGYGTMQAENFLKQREYS